MEQIIKKVQNRLDIRKMKNLLTILINYWKRDKQIKCYSVEKTPKTRD